MNESIELLNLEDTIISILKNNNINIIKDIWKYKRKELKTLGLKDSQINKIAIKLQLNGLDLDKKKY